MFIGHICYGVSRTVIILEMLPWMIMAGNEMISRNQKRIECAFFAFAGIIERSSRSQVLGIPDEKTEILFSVDN